MGLFDKDVLCDVCGNKAGLNRYRTKDKGTWVCATCAKSAGGLGVIAGMTVAEIKAAISSRSAISDQAASGDIQTAESMYQYCKASGLGFGWNEKWGVNHFRVIENALLPGEHVLTVFIGLHNYTSATKHDDHYAYAITNKRVIMGQKNLVAGEKLHSVYLENLNDISFSSGVVMGVMTIDTIKEVFNVGLDKASAARINANVHAVISEMKCSTESAPPPALSTADEIKKYKELLDCGAITEEEYLSKKRQLLNL